MPSDPFPKYCIVADLEQRLSILSLSPRDPLSVTSVMDLSYPIADMTVIPGSLIVAVSGGLVLVLNDVDTVSGRFLQKSSPLPRKLAGDVAPRISRLNSDQVAVFSQDGFSWMTKSDSSCVFTRVLLPSLLLLAPFSFQHASGNVIECVIGITSPNQNQSPQLIINEIKTTQSGQESVLTADSWQTIAINSKYSPRKLVQHSLGWLFVS
ncbi:hypothetical protein GEMRC1_008362 [Eukaryota sp. GEM-RC1]